MEQTILEIRVNSPEMYILCGFPVGSAFAPLIAACHITASSSNVTLRHLEIKRRLWKHAERISISERPHKKSMFDPNQNGCCVRKEPR